MSLPFELFSQVNFVNLKKGIILDDPIAAEINTCNTQQFSAENITHFTIIPGVNAPNIKIDTLRVVSPLLSFAGDSFVNFGKCALDGSLFVMRDCDPGLGDLYKVVPDIAITGITDQVAGEVEITTASDHNLMIGQCVELFGFSSSQYNDKFIVTATPIPTAFRIVVAFTGNETGTLNASSMDNRDVQVIANNNEGSRDSMWTGEAGLEIFGSEISSSSLAQDTFEVINSPSWQYSGLERTSIGINDQGQLVILDPKEREYTVTYSATIDKTSGPGNVNMGIVVLKNDAIAGFNPPRADNVGKVQIGRSNNIVGIKGDTFDIAVINYDGTAATIDTSQANLKINL